MGLQWDKPSTNWCRISSIHSMLPYLTSQVTTHNTGTNGIRRPNSVLVWGLVLWRRVGPNHPPRPGFKCDGASRWRGEKNTSWIFEHLSWVGLDDLNEYIYTVHIYIFICQPPVPHNIYIHIYIHTPNTLLNKWILYLPRPSIQSS